MRTLLFVAVLFFYCLQPGKLAAQEIADTLTLDELIISASKFPEKQKNIAAQIAVISASKIATTNAQNMGDLLMTNGNVFVQKSQQGGSSPVLRGFEANRILLVVDGIRMNNAIFRGGHLQNVITVDQNMLQSVELLFGPASTLYGSDALGGVILFRTKVPVLSGTTNKVLEGSAFARYSSVNNEKTVHADFNVGSKKIAWLQSWNYSDFGDVKTGSHDYKKYPGFGRRPFYITQVGGIDSIVKNDDDRIQRFSGYRQWDITQKVLFQPSEKTTHLVNLQYSSSGNVPRYDRLQDVRNGNLRFAEWYYGPQERALFAYELNKKNLSVLDDLKVIISYQNIVESRHQREYKRYDRFDHRTENVGVAGLTVDGRKLWKQHELTAGVDGQLNHVSSEAYRENITSKEKSKLDSRYPNGKNRMNYYGAYAQHTWKSADTKLVINDGLRLQYVSLHSSIADNSFFNFPFTDISQENFAVTGNAGIIYSPATDWRLNAVFSTGFRAPNIDDLSKIFESSTAAKQLVIPNPGVKPEYTYNLDAGITRKSAKYRIELRGFYTWFRNAISLAPFQLNGKDSVNYNGVVSRVYANQNLNKARLCGLSGNVDFIPVKALTVSGTLTFTKGKLQPNQQSEIALDHIPPVYGRTGIRYERGRWLGEIFALYNGWKRIEKYNPSGEDNQQYATIDGAPAWITLNARAGTRVSSVLTLQAGIENILDKNYRVFASGFSAPGRNIYVAIRAGFH